MKTLRGVKYVRDAKGRRTAVVIDLRRNLVMVQQSVHGDALNESLRTLVAQSLAAESAVKTLAETHATEAERWRAYYVARLARVDAECTAINPTPLAPRPRTGAQ